MVMTSMISFFSTADSSRAKSLLGASMIGMVLLLDVSQLVFALAGALCYLMIQAVPQPPRKLTSSCKIAEMDREHKTALNTGPTSTPPRVRRNEPRSIRQDTYRPSFAPVLAPKFESVGWEAEVDELITQIVPSQDEENVAKQLASHVRLTTQSLLPKAEVTGFIQGSLKCGKAFGVAVPEVEIVVSVSSVLLERLQHRSRASRTDDDAKKMNIIKSALRACTDRLVAAGGFKFRRSAFRGEEPRVTLLVPASLGFFPEAIPVDISVNAVTPFYTSALLSECGRIDSRARALILFVKRWAKDRGVCHGAKGHLSPYMWSLLVIYFLQVEAEGKTPLLPPLEDFLASPRVFMQRCNQISSEEAISSDSSNDGLSAGQLFSEFIQFYNEGFNWHHEAISIRSGKRAPPKSSIPLNVIVCERGNTVLGPTIEDPFRASSNLAMCMNVISLARLREELARARQLCARNASLTEMLEPWKPAGDSADRSASGSSLEPATQSSGSSWCEDSFEQSNGSSLGEDN